MINKKTLFFDFFKQITVLYLLRHLIVFIYYLFIGNEKWISPESAKLYILNLIFISIIIPIIIAIILFFILITMQKKEIVKRGLISLLSIIIFSIIPIKYLIIIGKNTEILGGLVLIFGIIVLILNGNKILEWRKNQYS